MLAVPWAARETGRLRFLGMIPDRRLCRLYRRATATNYPSLYEGFGFPVLDSLLHQTPVLCSFNSSLREFEGPGVHYFDPYDASTLDEAYTGMMRQQPATLDRADLRERCCWEKMAQTIVSLTH